MTKTKGRKIIHVDMDSFYASVEILDNSKLEGQPVAVGGSPESRSVVCTANYIAREYGVKAAVSSFKALKLCPKLKLIPPNFKRYKEESRAIHEIFSRFTDIIEPLSLDEAFLDVTDSIHFEGSATLIAKEIRRLIFKERGLRASAGIAPNKFLAKIASDWNKPNGQFVILPDEIDRFMEDLKIEKIFGVGKVTAKKMHINGIKTCFDLQTLTFLDLKRLFGPWGERLYELSRGIDERPVETKRERKSFSVEHTFSADLPGLKECNEKLLPLYDEFISRFIKCQEKYVITGVIAKVKFLDFKTTTVQRGGNQNYSLELFKELIAEGYYRSEKPVRLLGVGVKIEERDESIVKEMPELPLEY